MSTKAGEFDYVNRTYGLKLQRGTAILQVASGRRGVVARAHPGRGHYIDIQWDGCEHVEDQKGCGCGKKRPPHGPFHPIWGLKYSMGNPPQKSDAPLPGNLAP